MTTVAHITARHKFPVYEDMAEAQARLDYALDQQRHVSTHYVDETGQVTLGHRALADAQWAEDTAAGGLVALLMRR